MRSPVAALEVVVAHAVVVLEVVYDGLDGGAAMHLATNGLGDAPDLTIDPNLEAIRLGVAAVALVDVDAARRDGGKL